jgi:hypothetical protein
MDAKTATDLTRTVMGLVSDEYGTEEWLDFQVAMVDVYDRRCGADATFEDLLSEMAGEPLGATTMEIVVKAVAEHAAAERIADAV